MISSRDQVAHTFTDWTEIYQDTFDAQSLTTSVWEFRYAGVEPNLTVGHTSGANIVGAIAQLRGCDTSGSAVDTLGASTQALNSDTVTFASITPSTSNTLLLAVWTFNENLTTFTDPLDGFTQGFLEVEASAAGVYLYYKAHTSGATGELTLTMDGQGSNDENDGMLIAIGQAATKRRRAAPIVFQ